MDLLQEALLLPGSAFWLGTRRVSGLFSLGLLGFGNRLFGLHSSRLLRRHDDFACFGLQLLPLLLSQAWQACLLFGGNTALCTN